MKNYIFLIAFMLAANVLNSQTPKDSIVRTYDLHHIQLKIEPDWLNKKIKGNCINKLSPLSDTLTIVRFDAVGFDINFVKDANGNVREYKYDGKNIFINLGEEVSPSDTLYFEIDYTCTPQKGLYFVYPTELNPNLNNQIWTQGEAEDNRYWIPTYDKPDDKTTSEIYFTVENKYKTLSNGKLISSEANGSNKRTDHWVMDKPHSVYLIMLAAGDFSVIEDVYDNIPIHSYVPPADLANGEYSFRNTDDMMDVFNEKFGYKYPWNKYAQIVVDDFVYGGMENTTATVLNRRAIYTPEIENDYSSDGLISHELAHQWWGDLVTCKSWDEMWLNESFATYSTDLWKEEYSGRDEYDYNILLHTDEAMDAQEKKGKETIYGGKITENIYDKGAVVLNTFRQLLGDEIFFEGLSYYLKTNEYKNVETKDLRDALNHAYSTHDISANIPNPEMTNWMFDQWIYKGGYPIFKVYYSYDSLAKEMLLNVDQVQKIDSIVPLFNASVVVQIRSDNDFKEELVNITGKKNQYKFRLDSSPKMVIFDYGNRIMDSLKFEKPKSDWIMQITESRNAIDRILGIRGLNDYSKHDDVLLFLEKLLQSDPHWGVRREAAYVIGRSKSLIGREILKKNYDQASDSRIKRAILKSLADIDDEADKDFIMSKIKFETNNYIVVDGIETLGKILPSEKIYDNVYEFSQKESHRHVVKNAVIRALKKADKTDERVKDALKELAFGINIDSRVRLEAINALDAYADDEHVKELARKNLNYNFRYVKNALVDLLSKSKDEKMIAVLEDLDKNTTDEGLKGLIEKAIKDLSVKQ